MDTKLEKKLYRKYPKLFRQRKLDMSKSALCWGIQTGSGFYNLLDQLCSWITNHIEWNKDIFPQIEFNTVKEKFGLLRIYIDVVGEVTSIAQERALSEIYGVISFAESLSSTICETCGKPGRLLKVNNWYMTICDEDLEAYKKEKSKMFTKFDIVDCSKGYKK